MNFEDFNAAAKQVEHVTDCTAELTRGGAWVHITVEAYLANDDGSMVERFKAPIKMLADEHAERRFSVPGPWLLQTFDRSIAEKWQGYTRYATAEEITAYKSAKEAA